MSPNAGGGGRRAAGSQPMSRAPFLTYGWQAIFKANTTCHVVVVGGEKASLWRINQLIYSQIGGSFKDMNLDESKLRRMQTCSLVAPFLEFFFTSWLSLETLFLKEDFRLQVFFVNLFPKALEYTFGAISQVYTKFAEISTIFCIVGVVDTGDKLFSASLV